MSAHVLVRRLYTPTVGAPKHLKSPHVVGREVWDREKTRELARLIPRTKCGWLLVCDDVLGRAECPLCKIIVVVVVVVVVVEYYYF